MVQSQIQNLFVFLFISEKLRDMYTNVANAFFFVKPMHLPFIHIASYYMTFPVTVCGLSHTIKILFIQFG